jgi:hypothetical protein
LDELRDYLAALIGRFLSQPETWLEAVANVEPERLQLRSNAEQWSAHQVVAHVLAADRFALLPRIRRILAEERPQLPNWDEAEWMADEYDRAMPLVNILEDWQQARQGLAEDLAGLELSGWERKGLHPYHGERTLLWWLEYSVNHAKDHERQLLVILAEVNTKNL